MVDKKTAFEWVKGVIDSCTLSIHFDNALTLINLFDQMYNDFTLKIKLKDYLLKAIK